MFRFVKTVMLIRP